MEYFRSPDLYMLLYTHHRNQLIACVMWLPIRGRLGTGGVSDRTGGQRGREGADSITAAKTGWFRTGVGPVAFADCSFFAGGLCLLFVRTVCTATQLTGRIYLACKTRSTVRRRRGDEWVGLHVWTDLLRRLRPDQISQH